MNLKFPCQFSICFNIFSFLFCFPFLFLPFCWLLKTKNQQTVPFKMFATSGIFNPASGAIRRQYNDIESEKYSSINTKRTLQSDTGHWNPSNIASILDKTGSATIRSEFDRFSNEQFAELRHNDENDGLVFGSTQLYCDTKQYSWVWRTTHDTHNWWVEFYCVFLFVCVLHTNHFNLFILFEQQQQQHPIRI